MCNKRQIRLIDEKNEFLSLHNVVQLGVGRKRICLVQDLIARVALEVKSRRFEKSLI